VTIFEYRFKGQHDTIIVVTKATRSVFQNIRGSKAQRGHPVTSWGHPHSAIRAVDMRMLLLMLPFITHDLLDGELDDAVDDAGVALEDPSLAIIAVLLALLKWYHLYRRFGHSVSDLLRLDRLGKAFINLCKATFQFKNLIGLGILCCDKMHYIIHCCLEVMRWGSTINSNGEAGENAHKDNIKRPGKNTNQGPGADGSMMRHAQTKEALKLAGQAIDGTYYNAI
jgi:hypothetical protein